MTVYLDKNGDPFEVRECGNEDYDSLIAMYEAFTPKAGFQGMPPTERERRREWIDKLLRNGRNFLALRKGRTIGHVVFIPESGLSDGEYLIFVGQGDRNRGVGSRLTFRAVETASSLGLRKIWLTVGTYNFIAIRLYRKFGFDFVGEATPSERQMVLWL
jgi:ribosomal protein S18 acetylase RimI-like enzyme